MVYIVDRFHKNLIKIIRGKVFWVDVLGYILGYLVKWKVIYVKLNRVLTDFCLCIPLSPPFSFFFPLSEGNGVIKNF